MSLNRNKFLESSEDTEIKLLSLDSRDKVIIRLARDTGARATELLRLRYVDLFPDTNTIFITGLKGSRDRELPVTPEMMTALLKFIPFGIGYRRLEQIWRDLRPCKKKFHSLRHTFAVNLYRRTKDIKLVQLALGHKSPTSTAVYTDFIYSQEELRRILD